MTDAREIVERWRQKIAWFAAKPDTLVQFKSFYVSELTALLDVAEAGERARDAALLLANAYEELRATVRGESPALLNEDSGASTVLLELDMKATDTIRALTKDQP